MEIIKTNKVQMPAVDFSKEQLATFVQNDLMEIDVNLDATERRKLVNKVIAHYDDQRKDITRLWDSAKKQFANDVKEALAPAIELQADLTKHIDEMKEIARNKKLEAIKDIPGYGYYIQYHDIDEKWFNKTTELRDIEKAIDIANREMTDRERTVERVAKLNDLDDEKYLELLKSQSLDDVVKRISEDAELVKAKPSPKVDTTGDKHDVTLQLTGTIEQLNALKTYMSEIGVTYKKVK